MNTDITAEMFDAAGRATADAFRAFDAARDAKAPYSERVKLEGPALEARDTLNALQRELRDGFAAARGWAFAPKLSGHHRCVFVDLQTKCRVATVVHGYEPYDDIPSGSEPLPFSWCHGSLGFAVLVREPERTV
jgi:hypothetical protein